VLPAFLSTALVVRLLPRLFFLDGAAAAMTAGAAGFGSFMCCWLQQLQLVWGESVLPVALGRDCCCAQGTAQ
jgi:hypothetical protein